MGPENFQQGLSKFLNKFAFKNTDTGDLWEVLQTEAPAGVNVSLVMDTWTRQRGYPVVTVKWSNDSRVVSVSQEPFMIQNDPQNRSLKGLPPSTYQWKVPLWISTSEDPNSTRLLWLGRDKQPCELYSPSDPEFFKLATLTVRSCIFQ